MRLLFDQDLSPRLSLLLSDLFPESVHVREIDLQESDDTVVWDYAKAGGFVIVSKDSDFQHLSLLLGAPPQFIWRRLGNCTVLESVERLQRNSQLILAFGIDPTQARRVAHMHAPSAIDRFRMSH